MIQDHVENANRKKKQPANSPKWHSIDALVTKNSGGQLVTAKLTAARRLGIPVLMINRPPAPAGPLVSLAAEVLTWGAGLTA